MSRDLQQQQGKRRDDFGGGFDPRGSGLGCSPVPRRSQARGKGPNLLFSLDFPWEASIDWPRAPCPDASCSAGIAWESSPCNPSCEFLQLPWGTGSKLLFGTGEAPQVTAGLGQLEPIFLPGKIRFGELLPSANTRMDIPDSVHWRDKSLKLWEETLIFMKGCEE